MVKDLLKMCDSLGIKIELVSDGILELLQPLIRRLKLKSTRSSRSIVENTSSPVFLFIEFPEFGCGNVTECPELAAFRP
jgi:hypothetical protein